MNMMDKYEMIFHKKMHLVSGEGKFNMSVY